MSKQCYGCGYAIGGCWDFANDYCYRDGEYWSDKDSTYIKGTVEEYQKTRRITMIDKDKKDDENLYLDVLFGDWSYISKTKIRTGHQLACDLTHPNINKIFTKATTDALKVADICKQAYIELGIAEFANIIPTEDK